MAEGLRSGRSENDVISSLGLPSEFAKELKINHQIKSATNETKLLSKINKVFRAILAVCVLAPFNLIIVLGPFLALCGILVAFWSIAASGVAIGLAGVGISLFAIPFNFILFLAIAFSSLTTIGFSILFFIGCYYISLWVLKGTLNYLKWNLDFVIGD
jgi:uncharacterized membrane protein